MTEKRRFPRFKAKLPVKLRIFDRETNTDVTNDIDVFTKNVSRAGLCLILPGGWDCPECNNCLGWMYNLNCKLKNNHAREANRPLVTNLDFKITVAEPSGILKRPVRLEGRCAWISAATGPRETNYPVGISLTKASQKKMASSLSAP